MRDVFYIHQKYGSGSRRDAAQLLHTLPLPCVFDCSPAALGDRLRRSKYRQANLHVHARAKLQTVVLEICVQL